MTGFLDGLGKLSEPLTKLVEVTANGVGTFYEPTRITREAKANARAKEIALKSKIELSDIEMRSNFRVEYRERLRQENIEKVVTLSSKALPDSVSDDSVDIDWTLQYFDIIQDVCDSDMQILWSKILAGEVTKPGTYSKRTLQFLKTLDKHEAVSFVNFCSFIFHDDAGNSCVFEDSFTVSKLSEKFGYDHSLYSHFASIGLISEDRNLTCEELDRECLTYFGTTYIARSEGYKRSEKGGLTKLNTPFQFRFLTKLGVELFSIAQAVPFDNYVNDVSAYLLENHKVAFSEITK